MMHVELPDVIWPVVRGPHQRSMWHVAEAEASALGGLRAVRGAHIRVLLVQNPLVLAGCLYRHACKGSGLTQRGRERGATRFCQWFANSLFEAVT